MTRLYELLHGDCMDAMSLTIADNSVDAIVCDPPYELGFMGKSWDKSGIANNPKMWAEALRVLKPGGHLLAFSGSRTYHRMACAIEDGGFDIRDQIMWVYGSGFPKSHNLNGDWDGWGTALKPAHEPICVARKPLVGTVAANMLAYSTGGLNVNGCRIPQEGSRPSLTGGMGRKSAPVFGSFANTDVEKLETSLGRWPANLIHDGLPDEWSHFFYCAKTSKKDRNEGLESFTPTTTTDGRAIAADNAYQRGKTNRENHHPTVKPTELMAYLCRLITPPGGLVLDPFMGSGSTGKACMREGFRFLGIDLDAEYIGIARARIEYELCRGMV